jgi:hypothetical protein
LPAGVAVKDARVNITTSNTIVVPRRTNRMASGPGIITSFDSYFASEASSGWILPGFLTASSSAPLLSV